MLTQIDVRKFYLVKQKIELLKNSLWKFDTNLDNDISLDELLNFLDSHTTDGREFDRNLANKIFNSFDVNNDGKISIDEFIKTYIHMEEDLKSHKEMILSKKLDEENKQKEYSNKLDYYSKTEKRNANGMTNFSKIDIDISSLELYNDIENFDSLRIKISIGESECLTKPIKVSDKNLKINEFFEL